MFHEKRESCLDEAYLSPGSEMKIFCKLEFLVYVQG